MNDYLVFDLETGFKTYYERKGNFKFNPIVAIGLAKDKEVVSEYIYPNKLTSFKIEEKVLVGHNIKFDLLYIWHLNDTQDFFKRGGKVWDTAVAEYMLTGQQHKYPALRDIAVTKYGCKERQKKMEEYWNDNVDTMYIPKEIVLEDVENDVIDTESIYLQQVEKAKKLGMYELIEDHMDFVLATTEMEYNGIFIDEEILENNKQTLEMELSNEKESLSKIIERYWK